MSDTRVSYQTVVEERRTDPVGRLAGWMGEHPIWAGLIGGSAAVAIAMMRAFEGVRTAPVDALVISAVVVLAWVTLFYFLRGFFARQAIGREQVRRDLVAEGDQFVWTEEDEELRRLDSPTYRLYSTEVPEHMRDGKNADQPWPVWLVVEGADGRIVLESKITAGEASHYEEVDSEVIEQTDEVLPTGIASSLLNLANRAIGRGDFNAEDAEGAEEKKA